MIFAEKRQFERGGESEWKAVRASEKVINFRSIEKKSFHEKKLNVQVSQMSFHRFFHPEKCFLLFCEDSESFL